ncbi:MAG: DsbC family protein [Thermodesulfobacteriota bacterium]
MFRVLISTVFLICLFSISAFAIDAGAFEGKGCMGDCAGCHTLDKAEASKLLKTEKFKARITDIKSAPVKGLWEVEITRDGKNFKVYVDFGKKYLMQGVSFLPIDKIGERPPLKKVNLKDIPLDEAVVMGDPKAKTKIIVFDDPECPYCAKLHKEIKKVLKDRKDIAFYIKLFPLPIHPDAYGVSKSIVCARSAAMLDDAFAGKKPAPATCETDEIDNNLKLGEKLGIHGTPGIIFPDGRLLPGYVPAEVLLEMIDKKQ